MNSTPPPSLHWTHRSSALSLASWQVYEPAVKVELTMNLLALGHRLFVIDPLPLPQEVEDALRSEFQPEAVILTNGNHERAALAYASGWNLPIYAHPAAIAEGSGELRESAREIATLAAPALTVIPLPGAGPGEIALYFPAAEAGGGVLVVGDALINLPSTGFALLPERYCEDTEELRRSLSRLTDLPVQTLAFAHGLPMRGEIGPRIRALL